MNALPRFALALLVTLASSACAKKDTVSKPSTSSEPAPTSTGARDENKPKVLFETSEGSFTVELEAQKAPQSVANFLEYVDSGFYVGTIFHRVIPGFVIQGGGFTPELGRKETRAPIANEAENGLKNERGTLAMARTSDPNSATSQFYVNLQDNRSLDHRNPSPAGIGYAVFGRVTDGMDVVDKIAATPRGTQNGMSDVPNAPIVITGARRVK